jgi:hypothetical protein
MYVQIFLGGNFPLIPGRNSHPVNNVCYNRTGIFLDVDSGNLILLLTLLQRAGISAINNKSKFKRTLFSYVRKLKTLIQKHWSDCSRIVMRTGGWNENCMHIKIRPLSPENKLFDRQLLFCVNYELTYVAESLCVNYRLTYVAESLCVNYFCCVN